MLNKKYEFIPMLQEVFDKCVELANAEYKNAEWHIENDKYGRLFHEMIRMNDRIRYGGILGYDPNGMTETQRRVMYLARYQKLEGLA